MLANLCLDFQRIFTFQTLPCKAAELFPASLKQRPFKVQNVSCIYQDITLSVNILRQLIWPPTFEARYFFDFGVISATLMMTKSLIHLLSVKRAVTKSDLDQFPNYTTARPISGTGIKLCPFLSLQISFSPQSLKWDQSNFPPWLE